MPDESDPLINQEISDQVSPLEINTDQPDVTQSLSHSSISLSAGPLPSPDILRGYNNVVPGCAKRLVNLVEVQSAHRQELERNALQMEMDDRKAARSEARLGQIFALVIGMTAIISGSLVTVYGSEFWGGMIGTGGVVGLVSVFIMGRKKSTEQG